MADSKDSQANEIDWRLATRLVHSGTQRTQFGETSEALFLTSGYVYESAEQAEARFKGEDDGYIYSRFSNPTVTMFEDRMIALEGAQAARATATGMAAVTASLLCLLDCGDHIVSARALFGSCRYVVEVLLPRFGIEVTLIDGCDLSAWKAACKPNTKAFFLETPSNPTLELIDIRKVADIAHNAGARLIIDNVFATPLLQKPLELGADVTVYSATKHIDGQGRCLGGIVLADEEYVNDYLYNFLRQTGASMSPFNAWVLLKGLETLEIRVERAVKNAEQIADFLGNRAGVTKVLYPARADHPQADLANTQMSAGGTMVSFEISGGKEEAFAFMNALKIIKISNNLGDTKSLVTHPTTTTHQRLAPEARAELGIGDNLVRISVGIEDVEDLKEDIDQAF